MGKILVLAVLTSGFLVLMSFDGFASHWHTRSKECRLAMEAFEQMNRIVKNPKKYPKTVEALGGIWQARRDERLVADWMKRVCRSWLVPH